MVFGAVFAGSPRSLLVGTGWSRQVGWRAAQPVSMRWFQGQSRGSRRRRRRPVRMIRPATLKSRSRSRLGSQRRAGWSCQASVWVETSRSAASAMISSQIWLWAKPWKVIFSPAKDERVEGIGADVAFGTAMFGSAGLDRVVVAAVVIAVPGAVAAAHLVAVGADPADAALGQAA